MRGCGTKLQCALCRVVLVQQREGNKGGLILESISTLVPLPKKIPSKINNESVVNHYGQEINFCAQEHDMAPLAMVPKSKYLLRLSKL